MHSDYYADRSSPSFGTPGRTPVPKYSAYGGPARPPNMMATDYDAYAGSQAYAMGSDRVTQLAKQAAGAPASRSKPKALTSKLPWDSKNPNVSTPPGYDGIGGGGGVPGAYYNPPSSGGSTSSGGGYYSSARGTQSARYNTVPMFVEDDRQPPRASSGYALGSSSRPVRSPTEYDANDYQPQARINSGGSGRSQASSASSTGSGGGRDHHPHHPVRRTGGDRSGPNHMTQYEDEPQDLYGGGYEEQEDYRQPASRSTPVKQSTSSMRAPAPSDPSPAPAPKNLSQKGAQDAAAYAQKKKEAAERAAQLRKERQSRMGGGDDREEEEVPPPRPAPAARSAMQQPKSYASSRRQEEEYEEPTSARSDRSAAPPPAASKPAPSRSLRAPSPSSASPPVDNYESAIKGYVRSSTSSKPSGIPKPVAKPAPSRTPQYDEEEEENQDDGPVSAVTAAANAHSQNLSLLRNKMRIKSAGAARETDPPAAPVRKPSAPSARSRAPPPEEEEEEEEEQVPVKPAPRAPASRTPAKPPSRAPVRQEPEEEEEEYQPPPKAKPKPTIPAKKPAAAPAKKPPPQDEDEEEEENGGRGPQDEIPIRGGGGGFGGFGGGGGFGGNGNSGMPSEYPDDEESQVRDEDKMECPDCGRRFAPDSFDRHVRICKKVFGQKRKAFNVTEQRLPPEAKKILAETKKVEAREAKSKGKGAAAAAGNEDQPIGTKKKNAKWKREHAQFIAAIRAARGGDSPAEQFGDGGAGGGFDPNDDPDKKACPHCGRRFNPDAAARHIPICQRIFTQQGGLKKGAGRGAGGLGGPGGPAAPAKPSGLSATMKPSSSVMGAPKSAAASLSATTRAAPRNPAPAPVASKPKAPVGRR